MHEHLIITLVFFPLYSYLYSFCLPSETELRTGSISLCQENKPFVDTFLFCGHVTELEVISANKNLWWQDLRVLCPTQYNFTFNTWSLQMEGMTCHGNSSKHFYEKL